MALVVEIVELIKVYDVNRKYEIRTLLRKLWAISQNANVESNWYTPNEIQ